MCGIAGTFGPDRPTPSGEAAALACLHHRGPDAQGRHHARVGGTPATLLHTRLAIIYLDRRADQPMVRGGLTLAFNGEIYNYVELAEELRARGQVLSTRSDTEVLLEAWRCWGEECLDRLEGMWAFALLDEAAGELVLCRDRFGEKPLFHTHAGGTVYFASEPKALAALLGRPLAVNVRHLRRFLANGFRSLFKGRETFFEGVREVPPATVVRISPDGTATERHYWTLRHAPRAMTAAEAAEGVRARLRRAVELRLRADVPLAFCLSGGVDSTSLAAVATRELGAEVHAFSVIDRDERYDESANIATTVAELGCKHFAARTSPDGFFRRMEALVASHDAPVPSISYYVHSFLSEAIAGHGYKVAVSGTGADEIFTGYYDHYAFWLSARAGEPGADKRLSEWRATYGRWVNNPLLQDPLRFHREPGFRGHLYQNRELFDGFLVEPADEAFAEEDYTADLLRNRTLNELFHEVVPVILRADDLNSMRVSVENRSPFLDRELAEFAYSIPGDLLIRDGLAKWPLREAVRGTAPEAIRTDSRKRGFNASIDSLVDRGDPATRERLLEPSPVFDVVRREAVEEFLRGDMTDNSFSKFLFSFISAKVFLEVATDPAPAGAVAEPA